jgi:hypothetical protein
MSKTGVTWGAVVCVAWLGGTSACSSSADSGGAVTQAAPKATADAATREAEPPPQEVKLPDPSVCAGIATCRTCCDTDFYGGAQLVRLAESDCACHGANSCASLCSLYECNDLLSKNTACDQCLIAAVTGSCTATVKAQCDADETCKLYEACIAGCQ